MQTANYTIERFPRAFRKGIAVFAPVIILLVVCASIGFAVQDSHPVISRYFGILFGVLVGVFLLLTIFHHPASRNCPKCHRAMVVDSTRTATGTFSMTCDRCKVIWDLGYGTGE